MGSPKYLHGKNACLSVYHTDQSLMSVYHTDQSLVISPVGVSL